MAKRKKTEPMTLLHCLENTGESLKGAGARAAQAAAPTVESGLKRVGDLVDAGVKVAQDTADKARPQVEGARKKLQDEYLPKFTERAGTTAASAGLALAAFNTPEGLEKLATKLTGDKKAVKKAQKALLKASKELQKSTKAKKSGSKAIWIGAIALAGAAGAAYYLWQKSQPVEDPWSTPLSNRPADARPVGSTPAARADKDDTEGGGDSAQAKA